ncbi:MAG: pitrilysin family protein [Pseudomonadota bacterium]
MIWRIAFSLFICCFLLTDEFAWAESRGVFHPKTFTLENGLQVVVITNPRVPIVSQTIFYKVGGMDDPDGKSGMAHFLEHLMFEGESAVPAGKFSEVISRLGGNQNAATSRDLTYYYQHVPKTQLERVIQLEAGRMSKLTISPKHVDVERKVVLEERRMRIDNKPGAILGEATMNTFFWHHPYGRPVIGWEHEIETYTLEDAQNFYQTWYVPNNAIAVYAGDITVEEVRPLVQKHFGKISKGASLPRVKNLQEPQHRGVAQRVVLQSPLVEHAKFERLYPAPNLLTDGKKPYAIQVLSFILGGGGATSYLYNALVHEQKIASWVGVAYDPDSRGPSVFLVAAQPTPGNKIKTLERAIDTVLSDFLSGVLTEKDVSDAKRRMLAGLDYEKDPAFAGAREIGSVLAMGLTIDDVEMWPDRIKAVTLKQVQQVAQEILKNPQHVTAILLPTKKVQ